MSLRLRLIYVPKDSPIHRLDPRTKLIWTICACLIAYTFFDVEIPILVILFTIPMILMSRVGRQVLTANAYMGFVYVMLFLGQGLFNPDNKTLILPIGPVGFYREGLFFASVYGFRLVAMVCVAFLFIYTTHPVDLSVGLSEWGLPYRYGFIVVASLQMGEAMLRQVSTVIEALKSRALETEAQLIDRVKAYMYVMTPLASIALVTAEQLSISTMTRGFGAPVKRTSLREINLRKVDILLMGASIASLIVVVVTRMLFGESFVPRVIFP
jgi:energy-coupling factor transport system permease protein